jgi:hypothetical protein
MSFLAGQSMAAAGSTSKQDIAPRRNYFSTEKASRTLPGTPPHWPYPELT